MNYYNEYDAKTAAWLRELVNAGLIPNGDVDERSITEVAPGDLRGYTQCHFFAGIGGWSLALQLAGWPPDRPVWTGSCPCQPFSVAGKGLGARDERHLWPVFFNLIRECRPEHVFGEQVASAVGHGWLDGISADLEAEGYTCGAAVLGAHSVNSPHQRQRLYWVANAASYGCDECQHSRNMVCQTKEKCQHESIELSHGAFSSGSINWLDDTRRPSHERRGDAGDVGCAAGKEQGKARERQRSRDADSYSVQDHHWSDFRVVHCRDGKNRRIPTEPAFFPLAHGVPTRVVRLRGYGNAIVPQVAAEFIGAYCDIASIR